MRIKGLNKKEIASQLIYTHNIKRIEHMSIGYLRELLIEAIEVGYVWRVEQQLSEGEKK